MYESRKSKIKIALPLVNIYNNTDYQQGQLI